MARLRATTYARSERPLTDGELAKINSRIDAGWAFVEGDIVQLDRSGQALLVSDVALAEAAEGVFFRIMVAPSLEQLVARHWWQRLS